MNPVDMETVENETILFSCTAEGRPQPSITWYRMADNDSLLLVNMSDDRVEVNQTEQRERRLTSELTLSDVLPSDSGVYVCIAETVVKGDMSSATLTVNGECVLCTKLNIFNFSVFSLLYTQCYQ